METGTMRIQPTDGARSVDLAEPLEWQSMLLGRAPGASLRQWTSVALEKHVKARFANPVLHPKKKPHESRDHLGS